MKIKEIKSRLENENVKFHINGIFNCKNELKTFKTDHIKEYNITSVTIDEFLGASMNVEKFNPTCMWLYTYDMMENKTRSKIKYSDIIIIEEADN